MLFIITYLTNPARKRQPLIASECKGLPGCAGLIGYPSYQDQDEKKDEHAQGAVVGHAQIEDVDYWKVGRVVDGGVYIWDAEDERNEDDESHQAIEQKGPVN